MNRHHLFLNPDKKKSGMSLVEVTVALMILAVLIIGFSSAIMLARKEAEADIYESTAISVATGYLEQLMIKSIPDLDAYRTAAPQAASFKKADSAGVMLDDSLPLGVYTPRSIEIYLDTNGNAKLKMTIQIRPTITVPNDMPDARELSVYYKWVRPNPNQNKIIARVGVLKSLRY